MATSESGPMRGNRILPMLVVGVALGCAPPPPTFGAAQRAQVASEIRLRLDQYAAAVTAKDLDGILSFWSDSLVFAGDGAILGGYDEWAPIARQDNETTDRWIHWTWDNVHILPLSPEAGSATVEVTYQKILLTGDTVNGSGSWTFVLRREPEGWQVVHGNGHHLVR